MLDTVLVFALLMAVLGLSVTVARGRLPLFLRRRRAAARRGRRRRRREPRDGEVRIRFRRWSLEEEEEAPEGDDHDELDDADDDDLLD